MLTSVSTSAYPISLPNELLSTIFQYMLDAQSLEQHYLDKGEFVKNLRTVNKFINSEINKTLDGNRPDIKRAIVAGEISDIISHWHKDMARPGPERNRFINNVKFVIEDQKHIGLNIDHIFKYSGIASAFDIYDAFQTTLTTISEQENSMIETFELKAPIIKDFDHPERIYNVSYPDDVRLLFHDLIKISENTKNRTFKLLLDLSGSGITYFGVQCLTEVLKKECVEIEKLDLSETHICSKSMSNLFIQIKNKPITALHLKKLTNYGSQELFQCLKSAFESKILPSIDLLDISGSVTNLLENKVINMRSYR